MNLLRATCLALSMATAAAGAADLVAAKKAHEARIAELEGAAFKTKVVFDADYKAALEALEEKLKSSGDLDAVLVLRAEIERHAAENSLADGDLKEGSPRVAAVQQEYLTRYRKIEQGESVARLGRLLQYGSALRGLKRTLTVADQVEAAVAADTELAAVKDEISKTAIDLPEGVEIPGVERRTVDIPVKEKWGVAFAVKAGDTIGFAAAGKWRILKGGRLRGPGDERFFFAGRIDGGKLFKIGASKVLEFERDGRLELGMHEGGTYSNNGGKVTAYIVRFRL